MTKKPRTTKKPAKATRQPRQKSTVGRDNIPQRKARLRITPDEAIEELGRRADMAENIGRSIGDALGRRLEDLLAKPDLANRTMLHFSEERGGLDRLIEDAEAAYSKAYVPFNSGDKIVYNNPKPGRELSARMSPVDEAIGRLRSAITMAECATESTSERLCSALSPPMPTPTGETPVASGAGALAGILNELAERIYADNRRRKELLDRLEL